MSVETFSDRKQLTFEQAEGLEPLPSQLAHKEITPQLRAALWHVVFHSLENSATWVDGVERVGKPWVYVLYVKHVTRDHKMADEFDTRFSTAKADLKRTFTEGTYDQVFGLIEWLLREPECPITKSTVAGVLEHCKAAYRLVDGDTLVPISSPDGLTAIQEAIAIVRQYSFEGAREHLRKASSELAQGKWADSIRESVHAVESVARSIEPSGDLSTALSKLGASARVHPALKRGMLAFYGFSSDEKGIRHSLIDEPTANVDEADALFMLGACSSFVSYLTNRARMSDLLDKAD